MAFAREMHELFAIDSEELPPLFVQTLLSDQQHPVPASAFEQRITNRVFARLGLSRILLPQVSHRPTLTQLVRRVRALGQETWHYLNRPLAAATGVALFFMALMVVFASPSFAQGLRIIFGNTGVVEVNSVPQSAKQSTYQHTSSQQDTDSLDPTMPLFWLGPTAGNYAYQGMSLQEPYSWTKGVIVDLQYSLNPGLNTTGATNKTTATGATNQNASQPNQATQGNQTNQANQANQGTGTLDIREFQLASGYSAVYQVVADGSATPVQVGGEPAVYVNGMWEQLFHDRTTTYTWQSDTHCLLILERDGVVIWITGDPRDGLDVQTMAALAGQLVSTTQAQLIRNYRGMIIMHQSQLPVATDAGVNSEVYDVVQQGMSPGAGQFVIASSASGTVSSAASS